MLEQQYGMKQMTPSLSETTVPMTTATTTTAAATILMVMVLVMVMVMMMMRVVISTGCEGCGFVQQRSAGESVFGVSPGGRRMEGHRASLLARLMCVPRLRRQTSVRGGL